MKRNITYSIVKRTFDIAASAALVVVTIPLCAGISVVVRAESEGPVIFLHDRMGRDGRHFRMLKFRSMKAGSDDIEASLSDEEIEHSFLLEIERKVSADNVITIDQVEYEVDCRFSKQHIKLRYSPGLDDIYIVEADGTLTPIRLLNKVENAFVKRDKVHICRGED